MKVLFSLNHPAHYYLFKYIIKGLLAKSHEVKIVIKEKDVLETLLNLENVEYSKLIEVKKRKKNTVSILSNLITELILQDISLFKFCKKFKPDIMIGTDISITHIGKFTNVPSLVYNEDDFEINRLFCSVAYPFASRIISPVYTSVGKYTNKKISYNGIQKMAYLNPKYFQPDINIKKIVGLSQNEKYFIIRLVKLTAGHDIGFSGEKHRGIDRKTLSRIIRKLEPLGKIFLSSEGSLPNNLKKYKIRLPKNKMHDFMAYADLLIGDSQTMCAESGLLGTPFIRINDFVGKIKYLDDLEINYKMGWGVSPSEPQKILDIIDRVISNDKIREEWERKKFSLFNEKVDLVAWSIDLLEKFDKNPDIFSKIS